MNRKPPDSDAPARETASAKLPEMSWVSLRFNHPDLEAAFLRDYASKSLRQVRISLLLGGFLYAAFGFLDPQIIPDATNTAWWIRYAVVCPLILGLLCLSYFPSFKRHMQAAMAFLGLVAGFGIDGMIMSAAPPGSYHYYAGILLACTFIYTFMRLRFWAATTSAWAIVVLYELTTYAGTPTAIVTNNAFFLVSINILGMSACWYMEQYARADFLQQRLIRQQALRLENALTDVEQARKTAEEQSHRDPLTNLFNRRYFQHVLEKLDADRRRLGATAAILMDVDHFKSVNDAHGHAMGDRTLKAVAGQIHRGLRHSDIPCRYGGEEFAVLLQETDLDSALLVGRRLRESIEALTIDTPGGDLTVTVSVGIASISKEASCSAETLVDRADQALYAAKEGGRNRIKIWTPDGPVDEPGPREALQLPFPPNKEADQPRF